MVPAEYVPHVARLIAELDQQRRPLPSPDRRPLTPQRHSADWPIDELRRFAAGRSRTYQTVIPIMDYLAERPGVFHRVTDIVAALGVSHDKVNGAMAGLTRLVKNKHDYAALGLPVRRVAEREPGGGEFHVSYSMTVEQAKRWKTVRAAPDSAEA